MTDTVISKSIILNAPRDTVWAFLTEKDKLAEWFHEAEADLADQQPYTLVDRAPDGTTTKMCWGEVLEMTKPSSLVYSFTVKPLGGAMTTVSWSLEEVHGGTKLSLSHSGVDQAAGEAAMGLLLALDKGWDQHLLSMRTLAA